MFEPWVGENYGRSSLLGGKRILVVGESHHSEEHPVNSVVPNLTCRVMEHYGSTQARGEWMRTLDNVAWALSGKTRSDLATSLHRGELSVWQSVAFYNYIPVVLTDSARSARPTAMHYQMAVAPFEQVLRDIKPEVLIVCGYSLFPYLVRNHWPTDLAMPWDFSEDFLDVQRDDQKIRCIRMLHPSSSFSHKRWHTVISNAVASFENPVGT
ncbi:hypothetical protein HF263_36395 [Rhizobium leguminosarum]|uniref:hypothetical protein n=1 Tax=Rhizobium leguminosarum TaxID=384 RepID=UPI001C90FC0B|nr:hypothetical protein [Rhizobium leguminosarum]MBY2996737.1 hypothetical protein [Rhizobium leguminosarum]MBY3061449.1 hypothetical protein [Rhizobium leguminosarum]